ncbi:adenylate kinase [Trichodelitschia bisporula]|uniref:GTP:AMP phosphotransferase, mitochondrial n=1 Tax=Trichodelitschia bisporula TaxID=703511 RepID=A0A6G1I6C4_9PEZI|nr:adenylate kinase [Trichodelitschia bisporula]
MHGLSQLGRAARVILVGAPGVGKGTQTARLMKRFPQLSSLSSGDLLRENVRQQTPLGILAESKMKAGVLVPDAMMLRLILNEATKRGWAEREPRMPYTLSCTTSNLSTSSMEDMTAPPTFSQYTYSDNPNSSFILDGFPRTVSQASQIDNLIPINLVVYLNTPVNAIMERIMNRWVHAPSGRVYNMTFNPPKVPGKDDATGEALTRRDDDDPEVWKSRLRQFERTSLPLLDHYSKKGVLWTVNGNSSDEISPQLIKEFEKRFGMGQSS